MIETAMEAATTAPLGQAGLDAQTVAAGQAIAQQIAASDWLGPLAPIALSPFFGLAALSGMATYGPEWIQERSSLFGDASALNNPVLFWTMVGLAVLTSLPRFTKVSKPLALAADNLESYSAVIILAVVRFMSVGEAQDPSTELAAVTPLMLSAGIVTLPIDIAMAIFAGINVIVINFVKLFFEFMVWLVPFPTVDAMLEAANKTTCAALLALYAYSPTLATVVNLLMLAICLIIFGWVYRRLTYYREMVAGPILAWLLPGWFAQKGDCIKVFSEHEIDGFPAFGSLRMQHLGQNQYKLTGRWLWKTVDRDLENCQVSSEEGLVIQTLILQNATGEQFVLNHRRWVPSDSCYQGAKPVSELANSS